MPGIAIGQATVSAMQNAVEEGDEFTEQCNLAHGAVEPPAHLLRLNQFQHQRPKRCLYARHKQCGRQTLPGDVGNREGRLCLAEPNHVVVVSPDDTKRLRCGCNFKSGHVRDGFGKEILLDLSSFAELFLSPGLLAHQIAMPRDLGLNLFEQMGVLPGLLDKVGRAASHGFDGQIDGAPGGHHQHR